MRLDEITIATAIKEAEEKHGDKKGTYAGVKFSTASINNIQKYIENNNIPNAVPKNKLHTTLLYSRKHLPNYEPAGKLEPILTAKPSKFAIWPSQPDENGEPNNCLVLEYDCSDLTKRHKDLMKEHDGEYDWDDYKTHVTFSYNVKDLDVKDLPPFEDELEITEEYGEDLNLDWAKDNAKSSD